MPVIEGAQERGARSTIIPIEDLAAGAAIGARVEWAAPETGCILSKIGILFKGTSSGVDASNTATITIRDGASNTIVARTFSDAAPVPGSGIYSDMGTLNATHKILDANEVVTVQVAQGGTANLAAFLLLLEWDPR